MKKLFTLLGIMLCLAGLVSAQDCGFKVKFERTRFIASIRRFFFEKNRVVLKKNHIFASF